MGVPYLLEQYASGLKLQGHVSKCRFLPSANDDEHLASVELPLGAMLARKTVVQYIQGVLCFVADTFVSLYGDRHNQ